jgi:mono/diheme cytochrome c family protein
MTRNRFGDAAGEASCARSQRARRRARCPHEGLRRPGWLALLALLAGTTAAASAQEAATLFKESCKGCHTIGGGRLTGPDLKDVTKRKDRDWLAAFIANPQAVIDSGDPYAQQLKDEARGAVMTVPAGLSRERIDSLLDLIEAESKLPRSQFAGVQVSNRPLTADDMARGRELFLGVERLGNGGAACISCHTVQGLGALGGGKLGPDLTRVYERMQDRKQLAAWLSAPATPTMQPVFKAHPLQPEEILSLVAFFEQSAKEGREDDSPSALRFFLLGLAGGGVGLALLDALWMRRFRGVRRVLVHSNNGRGDA